MEFRQIQQFIRLSESESITQAARELYITQQALSLSMRNLEKELGTTLFLRGRRGIVLTESGIYLRDQFSDIVQQYQAAYEATYSRFGSLHGTVRFAVCPGFFRSISPSYLMHFIDTYPDVALVQLEWPDIQCERFVKESNYHYALTTRPFHTSKLTFLPLHSEPLYLIASAQHSMSTRSHVTMKELKNESFLFFTDLYNISYRTSAACLRNGFTPNIIYRSADVSQLVRLAAENKGVLICVRHVYEEGPKDDLVCIPIKDSILRWELGLLFRDYNKLESLARHFIDWFVEAIRTNLK